jgi:DNA polymerase I-like protein with 3'-5' exonuclease and polymerase domains|nr:MAG TPA_asm: DNA POLYMERASE [Caudoviricetes sp.]
MFTRYKIIRSFKELKQLVEACLKTGYASVDFETNGKGIYTDEFKPTILSVTFQVGSGCSIPLQHFDESLEWMQDGVWLDWLLYFGRNVIENPKVVKIAWNWKFDNQIFQKYHIYSRGTIIDGMLAKYLLNEERPNGLKDMVRRYLPEFADYEKYDKFETISWDKKPLEPLCKYGCMDTDFTFRLAMFLEKKLIDKGFYNLYRNLIMPASKVLQEAESNGLPFDLELNSELTEKYATLIKEVTSNLRNLKVIRRYEKKLLSDRVSNYIDKLNEEISQLSDDPSKARSIKTREAKISRVLAGEYVTNDEKKLVEPVNFNSQKQMVDLLYNSEKGFKFPILEYTRDAKTKKPTNNPSTSSETLEKLIPDDKTGFIKNLLDLRGLDKMNSTYILGLRELVQSDNRVHPTFLIHGTTSGRLSSRNPNGQNIPKVMVNPDIKRQFITPPGKLFLTYDYSQAELRILAHLAKEDTMLEWFRTGKDIHLASACKKYHEDYDSILLIYEDEQHELYPLWKKRRKQAKTINFGIVYEQSAKKLAESLSTPDEKVSDEEGQIFLDEYFETFPKIKRFMDRQHKFMEKHGYCESLFGRRRRCPKVYSDNYSEYLEALRQCVDEETEALTTDGWRRYDQLYNGQPILTKNFNTGILEWQPIENINIYPDYQGDLYSFEGKTFSALTNGKHRWLCNHNSKPGSKAEFLTTEELYNSNIVRPIHRTGEYIGNRKKVLDDDLVYLLGIILTDGHLRYYRDKTKPRYGKPWYAIITQSKEKNIPLIQSAIDKLDNRFTYIHKVYGKKHVWKFNKDFADYLDTIIHNKKLNMSLIHSLTKSQIRLLLDGMILGDGCKHGTRILTSSIEQANLIQVLVVMAGYYSNILINDNRGIHVSNKIKRGKIITKNISYLVTIGENKYFHHRSTRGKNHITKLTNQKKLIWCPTVKNGTWVCRRKGKTYITGNSTNMPCQSAASDMALFASIIVYEKVKKGELPPMQEVNTVHDSVYQFIEPRYITPDTIFGIWDICRNPSTKKYFGFEIKDVDMSMDFTVGRTMAEELPYIPGYDYNKMLSPNFDIDEYYAEHRKVKGIQIVDYPKEFKEYFRESWRKR